MDAGMTDTMLLYGGGSVGGTGASFVVDPPGAAYLAPTPAPTAATTSTGMTSARIQALIGGAKPANATEQRWLTQAETAMRGYATAVQAMAAEATRQAALGRDLYGQPLRRAEDGSFEQRVLDLVNVERARNGLGSVTYNRQLDAAAEGHNAQQARVQSMAHQGLGDADPGSRIAATGFAKAWGENVATGQLSPEQVMSEWMASPGHRRNILDPNFTQLGVSYTTAGDGRTYWAQEFGA